MYSQRTHLVVECSVGHRWSRISL